MRVATTVAMVISAAGALVGNESARAQPAAGGEQESSFFVTIPPEPTTLQRRLRFEILDRSRGLPQNTVNTIVQDRTGFMWLGTNDGLARWDGQRFRIFRHEPGNPASLSASSVTRLLLTKDGTLWVGTVGGGVNRYRADKGTFDRFTASIDNPEALTSGTVASLAEGADGHIYVGTGDGGLGVLDPATGKVHSYGQEDGLPPTVTALRPDEDGTMWVGTAQGLFRLDAKQKSPIQGQLQDHEVLATAVVTALLKDKKGDLWIGTGGAGLARYTPASKKVQLFQPDPAQADRLADGSVKAIHQDTDGRLWVATDTAVHIYDATTGRFERHVSDPTDARSLPAQPTEIFQDAAGVIWFGTFTRGAALVHPRSLAFRSFRTSAGVAGMTMKGKDLWITTLEGACRLEASGGYKGVCYKVGRALAVEVDRQGRVWVGTMDEGVFRLDPGEKEKWVNFLPNRTDPKSLAQGLIPRIHEDRAGNLWIAFIGGGLQRVDPSGERFHEVPLPSGTAYMVKDDPKDDNVIWVGSGEQGLLRVQTNNNQVTPFVPVPDDPENKADNAVTDFLFEGDDVVWLATYGGGLKRLQVSTKTFKSYRRAQGLPSDTVYSIRQDKSGKLWLSSVSGLVRFDPKTEEVKVFTLVDGLQSDEYTINAAIATDDGRMIFGGINGFDEFRPEQVELDSYKPPLVVTSIGVLGDPYQSGTPVGAIKQLSLGYDESFVTVEFAGLSFLGSDKLKFEYKIEGVSDKWLASDTALVSLAGLDDGDYTLFMRARNRHGMVSEPIQLGIDVAPPLWRTWYALVAYGLVLLGILFVVYRYQKVRIDRLQKLARLATVEREFEVTAAVQSWFLPDAGVYSTDGCDLVGFYRGAEKCSGDWWWYEDIGDNKLWIIVADVTGHGAGPAMLTAAVAMGIWVQTEAFAGSVVERLARVNREVLARCKGKATMTMTAVVFDQVTGEVDVYGLGGLPALQMGVGGQHAVIGSSGTPLGSVAELAIGERSTRLEPGDRLVITTDGIIETTVENGRPLGFRRFIKSIRETRDLPISHAVERIMREVDQARKAQPQEDDFTFCMLERRR